MEETNLMKDLITGTTKMEKSTTENFLKVLAQIKERFTKNTFKKVLKQIEFKFIGRCCECDDTFGGKFLDVSTVGGGNVLFEYRASNKTNTISYNKYPDLISIVMKTTKGCYCDHCISKYYDYDDTGCPACETDPNPCPTCSDYDFTGYCSTCAELYSDLCEKCSEAAYDTYVWNCMWF